MPEPLSRFPPPVGSEYILSYFNLKAVYYSFSVYKSFLLHVTAYWDALQPSSIWAQMHTKSDLNPRESINKLGSNLCHTFHCVILSKVIALFKWGIIITMQGYSNRIGFRKQMKNFQINFWHRVGRASYGTYYYYWFFSVPTFASTNFLIHNVLNFYTSAS